MATTPSLLDDLKKQAADIADKIKAETDKHLESLHLKLKEAHEAVKHLTSEIETHGGKPAVKRGRKPGKKIGSIGSPSTLKATGVRKAKGKKVAKRGALGESILKVLASKGKDGAHVKDIAAAIGSQPANVTSWFYSTGKKNKSIKHIDAGTFALQK